MKYIPNLLIPDFSVLFMSPSDYKKMEDSFWADLAKVKNE